MANVDGGPGCFVLNAAATFEILQFFGHIVSIRFFFSWKMKYSKQKKYSEMTDLLVGGQPWSKKKCLTDRILEFSNFKEIVLLLVEWAIF